MGALGRGRWRTVVRTDRRGRGGAVVNDFYEENMRRRMGQLVEENDRLKKRSDLQKKALRLWVKFWRAEGDDVWLAEEAMEATFEALEKGD